MCGIHLILSSSNHLSKHNLIEEEINALKARGPDYQKVITMEYNPEYNPTEYTDHISTDHLTVESPSEPFLATMAAAVLSLRGSQICEQPLRTKEVAFCWNGECYNLPSISTSPSPPSPPPPPNPADTSAVFESILLTSLPSTLPKILGEYAYIHTNLLQPQPSCNFGRDQLGRRTLTCNVQLENLGEEEREVGELLVVKSTGGEFEVPPGRIFQARSALTEAVRVRSLQAPEPPEGFAPDGMPHAKVGVLFSGGVDCAVVAALVREVLGEGIIVDLIVVSFGMDSKDREAAIEGWRRLGGVKGGFRLIVVDAEDGREDRKVVRGLIGPQITNMDYNIGLAFWKASGGKGGIYEGEEGGGGGGVRRAGEGWVTKSGEHGGSLYKKKAKCRGCGKRDLKNRDSGCYLGSCCEVCCKKIGRNICGGLGGRVGICGAHRIKGVEPLLERVGGGEGEGGIEWKELEELEEMGMLVYVGIFADFSVFDAKVGEGWVSDPNQHVTILHKSKIGEVTERKIKFGKAQIMVGDLRENEEFKVGRVKLKGREDLAEMAAATKQILHVTLRRREECEARMSTVLLKDGDGGGGGEYRCVDGYVGVCLELPNGVRVVCKDIDEVKRAKTAGQLKQYTSRAKVLLTGHGADEQMGGYGRHRTRFASGGSAAVKEELDMEMARIWRRNMGRDDRCIGGRGKEGRYPFLDEGVVEHLKIMRQKDVTEVCDFTLPQGIGDKLVLRKLAKELGLVGIDNMVKRAVQFGSRAAKSRGEGRDTLEV
ncbi:hypothetical protein TrCOL_g4356 [Triparma columacea]|uniref:Glutamine amidotransferase type-2 domain-containing protein n=1 Tax=Triparma columacea TaxID=722753 RepID=A0A9W7LC66_9STRA|nr:hypothetical protein TrCOL_g4356 [Triparma columacea]